MIDEIVSFEGAIVVQVADVGYRCEEVVMPHRGKLFRVMREESGLSTYDLAARSKALAELWGDKAYEISPSYITRLETGHKLITHMAFGKFLAFMEILGKGAPTLMKLCRPPRQYSLVDEPIGGPRLTQIVREGRIAELTSMMLTAGFPSEVTPTSTGPIQFGNIKDSNPFHDRNRYLYAIVGENDRSLYPMICPGALIIVDRDQRTISSDKHYDNEFDRSIYLIHTHDGYFCCWCDMQNDGSSLKIVQHPLGVTSLGILRIGREVEVVGEVVYFGMRRERTRKR